MVVSKRAAMGEGISVLPEPMIQHILSFLTLEEAARQTLLSKAWLRAWQTRPFLCFNERYLGDRDQESQKIYKKAFRDALYNTFLRYRDQNIGIERLELRIHSEKLDGHLIDQWIKLAAKNGVTVLELELNSYTLPPSLLEAKSLETLRVCGTNLKLQVPKNIRSHGLTVLHLSKVSLDEFTLQTIISSCSLIEYLTLDRCHGITNIKIPSLKNLRDFNLVSFNNQIVEVEAPSLTFSTCKNSDWSRSLKSLKLCGVALPIMFFFNLEDQFPNLEDLTIGQYVHDINGTIQISSHSLKTLSLEGNQGLEELQIDTPRLVKLGYKGHTLPRISITSASNRWVSNIHIIHSSSYLRMMWFLKLKKLLRDIMLSQISLCLDFDDIKSPSHLNFDEVSDSPISLEPQVQVEELTLSVRPISAVNTVVNGVFWSCHPKTIVSAVSNFKGLLFKMLMVRRNHGTLSSEGGEN